MNYPQNNSLKRVSLIIFLVSFFNTTIYSQSELWPDSNAVWYYTYTNQMFVDGYAQYSIDRDTIVDGKQCQIYQSEKHYLFSGLPQPQQNDEFSNKAFITCLDDSVLLHYVEAIDVFDTIIDFAANVGDSWRTYERLRNCIDANEEAFFTTTVQGKGITSLAGQPMLFLNLEHSHSFFATQTETFHQQVGPNGLFIFNKVCAYYDQSVESFRCYHSNTSLPTEYHYNAVSYDCDLFSGVGINDAIKEPSITVYPQPLLDNNLHISSAIELQNSQVYIHDLSGRLVLSKTICKSSNVDYLIELNNINAGNYIVQIVIGNTPYNFLISKL